MRRHDLHTVFIENILNIAVQKRQKWDSFLSSLYVGIELVLNSVVPEPSLQHKRSRILFHSRGPFRSVEQHGFYLTPRRRVSDGDRSVDDQARSPLQHRKILGLRGHHY